LPRESRTSRATTSTMALIGPPAQVGPLRPWAVGDRSWFLEQRWVWLEWQN
jgi:hypothetical protein